MEKKNIKKGKSDDNKDMRKLLFKNTMFTSMNTPRFNTIYFNNAKSSNVKIINKKKANKREEILNEFNNKKYN